MQRQYNVGLNTNPGSISLAVDKYRYPRIVGGGYRGPERAWPGDSEVRNRSNDNRGGFKKPPPKYSPAYTADVSHLIV